MKKILILLYGILLSFSCYGKEKCYPIDLRCEYLCRPLSIDERSPRLSWKLFDRRADALQTAYYVAVSTDSLSLLKGENILWSEEKKSNNTLIRYTGKELEPFTRYYWCVSIADKDGQKSSKVISSFETGMLDQQNWKGKFISDGKDIEDRSTPYFRKNIGISKKVKSARAYITAAGLYELSINGKKIGDHILDPAYTDFAKRLLYATYDVTKDLKQGENILGILLGNGWYNHQPVAEWNFHQADWRGRPSFCLNLRIVYTDGTEEVIASDRSFETTASPLTFNAIYLGEGYDFRRENRETYALESNGGDWQRAIEVATPAEKLVALNMPPIRITDRLHAKSIKKFSDTNYVFDFGQNWCGIIDGVFKGIEGTRVKIKHAESLDEKREHVYDDCLTGFYNAERYGKHPDDEQFQTDIIYLDGKKDHFVPRFSYKGFRYMEITSDKPLKLDKKSLNSCFVHTDVPEIGSFECSNPLFNKIMSATRYSYLSNLIGIPTDCPQREKNGWTGDAHLAIETGLYNYDAITFYEKWMRDLQDNMFDNGRLACIIPSGGWGQTDNTVDWTCAVAIIPWTIYEFYGDATCLAENYEMMKKHADFFLKHYPAGLVPDACLGDWCPYKAVSNKELTASICFFRMVDIIAKAARLFNKEDDLFFYRKMADKIKTAINKKFLNEETGIYASGYQAELSMPLRWNIVPEHCRAKVAANLSARVKQDNDHLDVGIFGCQALLDALTTTGNVEQAYRIANQTDEPSWGNWIERGATTLHEWWQYDGKAITSENHIMFGEIGAWLYKTLGGINPDVACPGFKNVILRPYFLKDISYVKVSYITPQGMVKSSWNRKGAKIIYKVTVPPNSTATLFLQKDEPVNLKSGTFTFEVIP